MPALDGAGFAFISEHKAAAYFEADSLVRVAATILRMTIERWAQIGITTEFVIIIRTIGEFFRLKHAHGANFTIAVAGLYVGGALISVCSCWAGVTLYFFRRYALSACITLAIVPLLLLYKLVVIGW